MISRSFSLPGLNIDRKRSLRKIVDDELLTKTAGAEFKSPSGEAFDTPEEFINHKDISLHEM